MTIRYKPLLFALSISAAFVYGVVVGKYGVFPHDTLGAIKQSMVAMAAEPPRKPMTPEVRASLFTPTSDSVDWVMLGDSITQAGLWSEWLRGKQVANRGVGGDHVSDMLARVHAVAELQPKKVLIMAGYNDLSALVPVQEVFENYKALVHDLSEVTQHVVIQSTLECSRDVCGETLDSIRELNQRLATLAAPPRVTFVDINRGITSPTEGLIADHTYDGSHLLGSGYQHWVRVINAQAG